ncbi:MAG: nucleotidyltransferase domain-containing protein [Bdellovibrionales bacterium]|nr:nucleotidyltransferase domain-containing protein [Bdellovibrionales bacterium]
MNIFDYDTGLNKNTISKIQNCFAKFKEIDKVLLYGSRAKGNYRIGSDIDLCIVGQNTNTNTVLKVENLLDDLMLPYSFDISVYHLIDNPSFVEHIDRVGITFYER